MSDQNNSPVALAPGSYDYDELKSGLDKAAKGSSKNYDEARDKALSTAGEMVHDQQDPRNIPGYRFEDVTREDLGVTERIQVFDPKLAEKAGEGAGDDQAAMANNQAGAAARGASAAGE